MCKRLHADFIVTSVTVHDSMSRLKVKVWFGFVVDVCAVKRLKMLSNVKQT